MRNLKWLLPIYMFLAPLVVTLAQLSVIEFPKEDPFIGMPYSPYPQVFYFPTFLGFILMILGTLIIFTFTNGRYKKMSTQIRFAILLFSIGISVVLFWFGINLAQRAVIIEYLSATNANGLHFLRLFILPILPEVFPNHAGEMAFVTVIAVGIIGIFGIILQCSILFNQKEKASS